MAVISLKSSKKKNKPKIKLAVVGSRKFRSYYLLEKEIDKLRKQYNIVKIISGGADGADTLAEVYAEKNNIPIEVILPNWKKHGKVAGLIRNTEIVKKSDFVLAFWDGKSKGTYDSIKKAKKMGKKLKIISF